LGQILQRVHGTGRLAGSAFGFARHAYVGRPVDVMQLKDGSLLVSDDWNGAVYRISYAKPNVAGQ
jgi:glucose/arabinose dehydrogenase